jgi:CRISPR-associated protein Cas8a1/Csx13
MSVVANQVQPKIQLHLGDPGMTIMHRAGMAGLWMTLKQLEKLYPEIGDRVGNLSWLLTPRSIDLAWEGNDLEALDWLLNESFQINSDGLISFLGLNPKEIDFQNQVIIHNGIRGTFLQHTSTFKSAGNETKSLQIEENTAPVIVKYQKAKSYAHQSFAQKLCDSKGNLSQKAISVAGWLNPGAVVRHTAFANNTGFEETPKHAIALLYAPVACQYFILRSRLRDKRAQFAIVIPDIQRISIQNRTQVITISSSDY